MDCPTKDRAEGAVMTTFETHTVDGAVSTKTVRFNDNEGLFVGPSGVSVVAVDEPTNVLDVVYSKEELGRCDYLLVNGRRALVRKRFLLWSVLDYDADFHRMVRQEKYTQELENYKERRERGVLQSTPHAIGWRAVEVTETEPEDPTKPYWPWPLLGGLVMVAVCLMAIGVMRLALAG